MKNIQAIQCKHCKNIIYNRSNHDYMTCSCGKVSIDSKGLRVIGDTRDFISLQLKKKVLLDMILHYDFTFGNRNIPDEYKNGYYGKFKIREGSNYKFFDKLIVGEYIK